MLTTRLRRYAPGGGPPVFEKDLVTVRRNVALGGNLRGLAVDSAGDAYVRNVPPGESFCKYDPAGTPIPGFREAGCFPASEATEVRALALDPEDNLYIWGIDSDAGGSRYQAIAQYYPAGAPLHRFGYLPGILRPPASRCAPTPPSPPALPSTPHWAKKSASFPSRTPGPLAIGPKASGVTSVKATLGGRSEPRGQGDPLPHRVHPGDPCEEDEASWAPGTASTGRRAPAEEELEIEGETPAEEEEALTA